MINTVEKFFGTKKITLNFTACSVPGHPCTATGGGVTHTFQRTQDALKEVIDERIYGGMHYRTSVVHGIVMSNKVAHWISKHYFLPVDCGRLSKPLARARDGMQIDTDRARVSHARIYNGVHCRTSVVHTTVLGRTAAQWVARYHFLALDSPDAR